MKTCHKMARTLLTVMAAACADPTAAAPSEAPTTVTLTTTTTTGPQTLNLDDITGKWWLYRRRHNDGPYESFQMNVIRKTSEEVAAYIQSWLLLHHEKIQDFSSDTIYFQNISYYGEIHSEVDINSYQFLIEALTDPLHIRSYSRDGKIELLRVKFTGEKLIFREVSGARNQFNFYRTLPDLATYARCESFDNIEASDVFDADSLVGTWATNTQQSGSFTLRVSRKTAEEVSAYRDDLRNTTIEDADIDWTKVGLEAELLSISHGGSALGLIEFLNKPGSIRVIPLKETWNSFGMREVDKWFTSQNLLIKKDDEFLAVKDCDEPWQQAYFSRRS